ncbi:MAG: CBS domain-containing protein [Nitrospina sp.]|jgi:signal-transduction protein with cAMP-binding, CBS, and nucleotidyltransferase domain|nr:CBS domain-containing protein [Nitrospina sp.]MBT5631672.1 CBS domain-containing protein [Nitrospina sp.]
MDKIQSYMNNKLSIISSEASAEEAANKMLEDLVHSLIVVEDDKHIGIVTDVDMTRKVVAPGLDPKETKVTSIMESPLITLDASLPMDEALLSMRRHHIRHIVATVDGQVTGVLSIHDFAHYHSLNITDPVSEFWSNSEVLLDEHTFKYAVDKLLSSIADKLGDSSKTGKAIKDKEPLPTISQYAIDEGLNDFSYILRLATETE